MALRRIEKNFPITSVYLHFFTLFYFFVDFTHFPCYNVGRFYDISRMNWVRKRMKLVFVAFDSVSHQPKSTNMISMLQDNHVYSIDSAYVDDVKNYTN